MLRAVAVVAIAAPGTAVSGLPTRAITECHSEDKVHPMDDDRLTLLRRELLDSYTRDPLDPLDCPPLEQASICAALNASLNSRRSQLNGTFGILIVCRLLDPREPCRADGMRAEGTLFASYAGARGIALAGNMDFVFVTPDCIERHSLEELMPRVAVRPRPGEPSDLKAAASLACGHLDRTRTRAKKPREGVFLSYAYDGAMAVEMRSGLGAWWRCDQRVGSSIAVPQPMDDVAVHFRCGDSITMNYGNASRGLFPFHQLLHVIPSDKRTTVGIITQPFVAVCQTLKSVRSDGIRPGRRTSTPASSVPAGGGAGAPAGLYHHLGQGSGGESCSCVCAAILDELQSYIRQRRPLASIRVRDGDERLGSEARLALAPVATVCMGSSNFCRWPCLAGVHGTACPPAHGTWSKDAVAYATLVVEAQAMSGSDFNYGRKLAGKQANVSETGMCLGVTEEGARRWVRSHLF